MSPIEHSPQLLVGKRAIAGRYTVSVRTVDNLMARGVLPFYKLGKAVRFSIPECDLALQAYRVRSRLERTAGVNTRLSSHVSNPDNHC